MRNSEKLSAASSVFMAVGGVAAVIDGMKDKKEDKTFKVLEMVSAVLGLVSAVTSIVFLIAEIISDRKHKNQQEIQYDFDEYGDELEYNDFVDFCE